MKTTKFQNLIKTNRKLLMARGFRYSTLYAWSRGLRRPTFAKVGELAAALGIELNEIPWVKWMENE